jgi:hypothetical protein
MIPCEGSGCPAHLIRKDHGVCAMCGEWVAVELTGRAEGLALEGVAVKHQRQDILAQIDRGDYG